MLESARKAVAERYPETEVYRWSTGHTARREDGVTENGNRYAFAWVLRNADGGFVDQDRYRHDLFDRHRLPWREGQGPISLEVCYE